MGSFFVELLGMFRERVKNVLLSIFTFSWVVINWKLLFILFFDKRTPIEILETIEKHPMYSSFYIKYWNLLLCPLLISLFHIYILSWFNERVYSSWLGRKKRLSDIRVKIEGETFSNLSRSAEIVKKRRELEKKISESDEKKKNKLFSLKNETDYLKKTRGEDFFIKLKILEEDTCNVFGGGLFIKIREAYKKGESRVGLNRILSGDDIRKFETFKSTAENEGFDFKLKGERKGRGFSRSTSMLDRRDIFVGVTFIEVLSISWNPSDENENDSPKDES